MSLFEYNETHSVVYPQFVEINKKHERSHWTSDEIKLQRDVEQWKSGFIDDVEKYLVMSILRLFTQSDRNVGTGYLDKLIPWIKNNEARGALTSFACREFEHQRAYALLSDTLGLGDSFYQEFLQYSEMREKHEYQIEQVEQSKEGALKYLAKQTMIEGISLFSSFGILLNFDRVGKLPGMVDINKWSFVDESIHVEGNTSIFRQGILELPHLWTDDFKKELYTMCRTIVTQEDAFIDKCYEICPVIANLDKSEVKQYIRYVADYRLKQFGLKPNYGVDKNPLPWIDYLMGSTTGNFFEREVVEYSKSNLSGAFESGYAMVQLDVTL